MPTVVTIAILVWTCNWINDRVATPITGLIIRQLPDPDAVEIWGRRVDVNREDILRYGTPTGQLDPTTGRELTFEHGVINHQACDSDEPVIRSAARERRAEALWHIFFRKYKLYVVGFLLAIVAVYAVGYMLSGLIGRTVWRLTESGIQRIPLIRSVYPNIKQVTDFLFGDRLIDFKGVVAVEYPRRGMWSLGLVTGQAMTSISAKADTELLTIFVPSSPTPVTGYTITVPRSETIELALSIDEALRFTISGGVIKPPAEGGRPEMSMTSEPTPGTTGAATTTNRLEAKEDGKRE